MTISSFLFAIAGLPLSALHIGLSDSLSMTSAYSQMV